MELELIKRKISEIGLDATSVKFLNKGTSKDSYIIIANGKKHVLKLFKKEKKSLIQKQMELMKIINKVEKITIFPIHKKVLDFNSKVGYVYEFVKGKTYEQTKIRNKPYHFGKLVGHFNKLTKNILPEKKDKNKIFDEVKDSKRVVAYIGPKADSLHQKTKRLVENSADIITKEYKGDPLRTQLIHGDLHQSNVYSNKGEYTILDMDGLENSILIREIATYVSYVSYRSIKKYGEEIKKIIQGYESEYKITKKEKELIPIILIIRKLGEITYLLKQEYKKKLTEKEIKFYLGHTTRKLYFITKNYQDIKKIFSKL